MDLRSERGSIGNRLAASALVIGIVVLGYNMTEPGHGDHAQESAIDVDTSTTPSTLSSPEPSPSSALSNTLPKPISTTYEPVPTPKSYHHSAFAGRAICRDVVISFHGTKKQVHHDIQVWERKHPGCESQILNNFDNPKHMPFKPSKDHTTAKFAFSKTH